jgi:hypothetical protein
MENQEKQGNQTLLNSIETLNRNLSNLLQKLFLDTQPDTQQISRRNSFDDLQISNLNLKQSPKERIINQNLPNQILKKKRA